MRNVSLILSYLLAMSLTACATQSQAKLPAHEEEVTEFLFSWEEASQDTSCVEVVCADPWCALVRCGAQPGPTFQLARSTGGGLVRPLMPSPQRFWGRPQSDFPGDSQPIFIIPWHNHERRAYAEFYQKHCGLPPGRYVRHHVFPQEPLLAAWFKQKGINIHAFTLLVEEQVHRRIHSGGPRGGMWNEAWRKFRAENPKAGTQEIWRFAFKLIERFELQEGPFIPYRSKFCEKLPPPNSL